MTEPTAGYARLKSRLLRRLVQHAPLAVAAHWMFQSLLYMDRTERRFKLSLDLGLTLIGGLALSVWLPGRIAWPAAFLLAHTLNFLFNGQLWGVLKHYGWINHTYEAFTDYVQALHKRAQAEPAIRCLMIYGGLSRRQWTPSSDLDARIVRQPGFINGLRVCCFLLHERSRALLARFPLDIYILDPETSLRKLNPKERPIHLIQKDKNR